MKELIDACVDLPEAGKGKRQPPVKLVPLVNPLLQELEKDDAISFMLAKLREALNKKLFEYVLLGLVRTAFLIEADKNATGTRLASRWGTRLTEGDPRRASFDTCYAIFLKLLSELSKAVAEADNVSLLQSFFAGQVFPYELPIDYIARRNENMHAPDNLVWVWERTGLRDAMALRAAVRQLKRTNRETRDFCRVLSKKVKVKAYQTDRAKTGQFKTNREKRWEALPSSPQFAFRIDCILIYALLTRELILMQDFPPSLKTALKLSLAGEQFTRCPITLDPLSYTKLAEGVLKPDHGKSRYQVGHMAPLKGANPSDGTGHSPENIHWVTEDGNRIQGNLSLEQVRELLTRVVDNYEAAGTPLRPTPVTPDS